MLNLTTPPINGGATRGLQPPADPHVIACVLFADQLQLIHIIGCCCAAVVLQRDPFDQRWVAQGVEWHRHLRPGVCWHCERVCLWAEWAVIAPFGIECQWRAAGRPIDPETNGAIARGIQCDGSTQRKTSVEGIVCNRHGLAAIVGEHRTCQVDCRIPRPIFPTRGRAIGKEDEIGLRGRDAIAVHNGQIKCVGLVRIDHGTAQVEIRLRLLPRLQGAALIHQQFRPHIDSACGTSQFGEDGRDLAIGIGGQGDDFCVACQGAQLTVATDAQTHKLVGCGIAPFVANCRYNGRCGGTIRQISRCCAQLEPVWPRVAQIERCTIAGRACASGNHRVTFGGAGGEDKLDDATRGDPCGWIDRAERGLDLDGRAIGDKDALFIEDRHLHFRGVSAVRA